MADERIALRWIDLDATDASPDELTADERARAERLRSPLEGRRFVARRAMLRRLLGERLGRAPATLRFVVGTHGKPALADVPLAFSLAHRGGVALLAVGGMRAIGVDCERVEGTAAAMRDAVDPLLSPDERAMLAGVPEAGGLAPLFRLWTRKEALAKAAGLGLAFPLASATVIGHGDGVSVAGHGCFCLRDLAAPPGMVAALCGVGATPLELADVSRRASPSAPG